MMQSISLEGKIEGGASISFLSVEVPFEADRYIPLALVRYAIDGKPQAYGLRLDLDKRTFADHLDNPDQEKILDDARGAIIEIAAKELRRREYQQLQKEFG